MSVFDIFTQGVGFAGLAVMVISYQIRDNGKLFFVQSIGNALFALQFILLSGISGAAALLITMVRNLLYMKADSAEWASKKFWPWLFAVIYLAVGIWQWDSWKDILPLTACLLCCFVYWNRNARHIRTANLFVASPCWITYDILVGTWGGIINEILTMGSILISIKRYGWKNLGMDPEEIK